MGSGTCSEWKMVLQLLMNAIVTCTEKKFNNFSQSQADKELTIDTFGEVMPSLQEIHAFFHMPVNTLEGGAPDVQVERRSTAGTGSGIVELKTMHLGTKIMGKIHGALITRTHIGI